MPCRGGCSSLTGRRCYCARRLSARHKHENSAEHFCTADTCFNPEFCIRYKPQICPYGSPNQASPAAAPAQSGLWPTLPPDLNAAAPSSPHPPHSHHFRNNFPSAQHPLSSHSSQHSCFAPQGCGSQQSNKQASNESKRLTIGKPSLTRLDSHDSHDAFQSGNNSRSNFMTSSMISPTTGKPSFSCCDRVGTNRSGSNQNLSNIGGYSVPSCHGGRPKDRSTRSPRHGHQGQPMDCHQGQEAYGNAFGSNRQDEDDPCECCMPPAFARFRCTGNLSGLCDCHERDDNK